MARMVTRFFGATDALEALKNDSWLGSYEVLCEEEVVRLTHGISFNQFGYRILA